MKLEYDIKENYTKLYNDAQGVYMAKNKIKKHLDKKVKIHGYLQSIILPAELLILVSVLMELLNIYSPVESIVFYRCVSAFLIFMCALAIILFFVAAKHNIGNGKGTLETTEAGIMDISDTGVQVLVPYDKIDFIVYTKNLAVIITQMPILIFIPKSEASDFIASVKEHIDVSVVESK